MKDSETVARHSIADYNRTLTQEQRIEAARRAGRASAAAARKKRTFRQSIEALLTLDVTQPAMRAALEAQGVDPSVINGINHAISDRALQGDVEAARFLRDSVGERPRDALDVAMARRDLSAADLPAVPDADLLAALSDDD